jgi:hypothetical protein
MTRPRRPRRFIFSDTGLNGKIWTLPASVAIKIHTYPEQPPAQSAETTSRPSIESAAMGET